MAVQGSVAPQVRVWPLPAGKRRASSRARPRGIAVPRCPVRRSRILGLDLHRHRNALLRVSPPDAAVGGDVRIVPPHGCDDVLILDDAVESRIYVHPASLRTGPDLAPGVRGDLAWL